MAPRKLFIFGIHLHEPLLNEIVAGAKAVGPATFTGYELLWASGNRRPRLFLRDKAKVTGRLIELGPEDLRRFDFYESVFGCTRHIIEVEAADGIVECETWLLPEDVSGGLRKSVEIPWSLEAWRPIWGAVAPLAAAEILRQRAQNPASEIAARIDMIEARANSVIRTQDWVRPGLVGGGLHGNHVSNVTSKNLHSGFFVTDEMELRHRRFNGEMSKPLKRTVFSVSDAVTVLPYDPVRDRILVIEQLRFGAFAFGDPAPWLIEPVAGIVDAGETPQQAARRETLEESRLSLKRLHKIGRYYPSPGGVAQVLISYIAICDLPQSAAGLGGHEAEGEDIRSHVISFDKALEMMRQGDVSNAPLLISLQYLMLHRDELRGGVSLG